MGAFRPRVLAVAVKIETTSGTDSVPTLAANAVSLIGVPTIGMAYLEAGKRGDVVTGVLGNVDRAAPAGRHVSIDLKLEVKGFGAAYSAVNLPEIDALLRGSGLLHTVVVTGGSESVTYVTLDDQMETFTLYAWTANKLWKLVGCVAKPKLTGTALQRGIWDFNVIGKLVTDPATTAFSAPTLNQTVPPLFHSGAAQIGAAFTTAVAEPLIIKTTELDFGTTVSERSSAGATDGIIGWTISDRNARQKMTIEQVTLATFDPYAASKQNSSGAIDTKAQYQWGNAQYNRLKVFTGRWAIEAPTHPDVNNLSGWDLQGDLVLGTEPVGLRELRLLYD
jgi:hypothetical protein